VVFGSPSDEAGFTSMWARLYGPDAAVLEQRLEEMARGVCKDDPRTLGERRSEALTALPTGITQLACECGNTDCPAAARDATAPAAAVIHVVAHADTIEAAHTDTATPAPDTCGADGDDAVPPEPDGDSSHPEPDDDPAPVERPAAGGIGQVPRAFCLAPVAESASAPPALCPTPPAFVIGGGVLPAPLLAAALGRATVREIRHPGVAPPEPQYRPSRDLADFVRCRDLTCRWPGCDKPAYGCDIDHTVPYPIGPTHASNTKCYCRFHHLLKTFYCGVGGWREQQLPDATLILTSPTGHTYTTKPGSAVLFPALCRPTATLWAPGHEPTVWTRGDRGAMMPKRRRTRAENLAKRIQAERKLNDEYVAERNKPPPF
jgi:hypothetical protein